jgi:hypothetical protein
VIANQWNELLLLGGNPMNDAETPRISNEVRASFEPIMKALGPVRQELLGLKDVIAVRPGYAYPSTGNPIPAVVVAVTPGTR